MCAFAQEKHTISGYVKEAETGEYLIGATVYLQESMQGTTTNQYGFYSLTVNEGKYTIDFSFSRDRNFSTPHCGKFFSSTAHRSSSQVSPLLRS